MIYHPLELQLATCPAFGHRTCYAYHRKEIVVPLAGQ